MLNAVERMTRYAKQDGRFNIVFSKDVAEQPWLSGPRRRRIKHKMNRKKPEAVSRRRKPRGPGRKESDK